MKLTEDNYYSAKANEEYMSVSQYKSFVGSIGVKGCEAKAFAEEKGLYISPSSESMLVGSYVDRYFEGTLSGFQDEHPEIFRRDGELKAPFQLAEALIRRVEQDGYFMAYMSGRKQVIMTAKLFGAKWKIKMDSYLPGIAIVDLKVMKSLRETHIIKDIGVLDFVRYWGYDIQGAIYQEVVRLNTGQKLPFYIAGISKENPPDFEIIHVDDIYLEGALEGVKQNLPHVLDIKAGRVEPRRCGHCAYCKSTKKIVRPLELSELVGGY